MRARILSFTIVLIALFSFENAYAQNPQINFSKGDPIVTISDLGNGTFDVCIEYCKLSGLGSATSVDASLTVTATGTVTCYNDAQLARGEDGNPTPGQRLTVTGDVQTLIPRNGTLTIRLSDDVCGTVEGSCKNANFNSFVTDLIVQSVILNINNTPIDLTDYIDD